MTTSTTDASRRRIMAVQGRTLIEGRQPRSWSLGRVEILKRLHVEVQTGDEASFAFMVEEVLEPLEIAVGAMGGVNIDRVVVADGG